MTERSRAPILFAVAAVAGAGFALLARAVARRDTARIDHKVHEHMHAPEGHPVREIAEASSPIGKWFTYVPAAALTGSYVVLRRFRREELPSRIFGTMAILFAANAAAVLADLFDEVLPQPPPPPGRPPEHPVFPSGHGFGTGSVAMTAAYVLAREGFARAGVVFPAAMAVPIASSAARMAEEKHWISDVIGAHLAALTLSALALGLYEAAACPPANSPVAQMDSADDVASVANRE